MEWEFEAVVGEIDSRAEADRTVDTKLKVGQLVANTTDAHKFHKSVL